MVDEEDWSDCFVTFEQTKAKLEQIESSLAARLGITGNIRETLIRMCKDNTLTEDDLVQDWFSALASYEDYMREHENLS